MKHILTQDGDILNALEEACNALGIDLKDTMHKLGLSPSLLLAPGKLVPSLLFGCILEAIARDYHCHDLALHVARKLQAPQLGLAARLMSLSTTLRSGLDKAHLYSAFYQDTSHWQHKIDNDQLILFKTSTRSNCEHWRQRNLFGIAQMFMLLKNMSGRLWRPSKISFSSKSLGGRFSDTFQQFFQCELAFEQAYDAIHIPIDALEFSVATCDVNLMRGMETQIKILQQGLQENRDFIGRARLIIDQRLSFAGCSQNELAFYMAVTEDQLNAELAKSNISFELLLEQQIAEKARYYLSEFKAPHKLIVSALMPDNEARLAALLKADI